MKNKKIGWTFLLLGLICFISIPAQSQMSILFVDDTDDIFQNAETFYEAIDALEYDADYYDAVAQEAGPSFAEMESYDLVIWHTSTDGVGLYLWEGQDEDNPDLTAYLETGGNLWLVGLDFLFDRYGTPVVGFDQGDFVFDFLGFLSYNSQSYGDDGEMGVPSVSPIQNAPIPNIESISWNLETLWWVDGVTPTLSALPIYEMSGESYPLAGDICAVLKQEDNFTALTYLFDLGLATPSDLLSNTQHVLEYFENLVLSAYDETVLSETIIYPNPARTYFRIQSPDESKIQSVSILNSSGTLLAKYRGGHDKYPTFNLAPGVYSIIIQTESGLIRRRLMKV